MTNLVFIYLKDHEKEQRGEIKKGKINTELVFLGLMLHRPVCVTEGA